MIQMDFLIYNITQKLLSVSEYYYNLRKPNSMVFVNISPMQQNTHIPRASCFVFLFLLSEFQPLA